MFIFHGKTNLKEYIAQGRRAFEDDGKIYIEYH